MKRIIILISFIIFNFPAYGEELSVKIKCKNGKCIPVSQEELNNVQLQNLKKEVNKIKNTLNNIKQTKNNQNQLENIEKENKRIENALQKLSEQILNKTEQKELDELKSNFRKLCKNLEYVYSLQKRTIGRLAFLENEKRTGLNISLFGATAINYEYTSGLFMSLDFPLNHGSYGVNIGSGLGVSPSNELGSLFKTSVYKDLDKITIGLAMLYMKDVGNIIVNNDKFILATGLEFNRRWDNNLFLTILPFVGMSERYNVDNIFKPAVYTETTCGNVIVSEAQWSEGKKTRDLAFTWGVLMFFGVQVF